MSAGDVLIELDRRTDDEAPSQVAHVPPAALIEIVQTTLSVGGAIWIRVTGKSMNPLIRHGDRVLITAVRGLPPRGAIVLLDADGTPLLHRVASRRAGLVITKGDNRAVNDAPRPLTSVLGQAVVVRRDGLTIALRPTLAFGVAPLLRAAAWWVRGRIPESAIRLLRGRPHGA